MADNLYECKDFSDIGRCFKTLHSHIDSEVEALKLRQDSTEKKVEIIDNHIEHLHDQMSELHNKTIPNLEALIEREATERKKLELWGRKWNVIVRGIDGVDGEPAKMTERKFRAFLHDKLDYGEEKIRSIHIAAAHRLPSGPKGKRNIIVRISSLNVKDEIMKAAISKLQKGSGYSIVPDLPPDLAILRGNLLKERSEMSPSQKKNCRLVYLKDPPFLKLSMKPRPRNDSDGSDS